MFNFFQKKTKCPYCGQVLASKLTRKQNCPNCGKPIYVRNGEHFTEEDANIRDWLSRLEGFGVTRNVFDSNRSQLSKKFGKQASVNETIWSVLNQLVMKHGGNSSSLEGIYRKMASLVSSEGKDPTQYLLEAEKIRGRNQPKDRSGKQVFLGHDELAYVRKLRKDGKSDKAEELLLKAEPSPAVLDELRKISSERARSAKRNGDWELVVKYLEGYVEYATKWRDYCVDMVNQEPPPHTASDNKLLQEAKQKLGR